MTAQADTDKVGELENINSSAQQEEARTGCIPRPEHKVASHLDVSCDELAISK